MRKWLLGVVVLLLGAVAGCGDDSAFTPTSGEETVVTYSEATVQEWLGICMEGPSYEAYCRCQADATAPLASEALFLENMRSPLFLLPDEAMDEQHRLCDHLEPALRVDGVAGVAFGTALEPAIDALVVIFGEPEVAEVPACAATVAAWDGLRLTFSTDGLLAGWAYGAFGAGDDADPLGVRAQIDDAEGTWYVDTGDTPWSTYSSLVVDPGFVADDPPMLVLSGSDEPEESLRAMTAGTDPADPILRLEAGHVCAAGS